MPIGKGNVVIGMGSARRARRSSKLRGICSSTARPNGSSSPSYRGHGRPCTSTRSSPSATPMFLTAFAPVIDHARAISLRPDDKSPVGMDIRVEDKGLVDVVGEALGVNFTVVGDRR